jgi:hypothetical protein
VLNDSLKTEKWNEQIVDPTGKFLKLCVFNSSAQLSSTCQCKRNPSRGPTFRTRMIPRLFLAWRKLVFGTAEASIWYGGGYFWHGGGYFWNGGGYFLSRRRLVLARRRLLFFGTVEVIFGTAEVSCGTAESSFGMAEAIFGTAETSFWQGGGYFWHGGG